MDEWDLTSSGGGLQDGGEDGRVRESRGLLRREIGERGVRRREGEGEKEEEGSEGGRR